MGPQHHAFQIAARYEVAVEGLPVDGAGNHRLAAGAVVVCSAVSPDGTRIRINSPAGWVDAAGMVPAPPAASLKLDYETFLRRHRQVHPGDTYGLEFPISLAMLEEMGPDFLTRAFHASGVLSAENRVTAIAAVRPIEVMGASENALIQLEYARPEPGLEPELFIKLPPADETRKFGLVGMTHGEVAMAQISQRGVLPVETAQYRFGDYCAHTGNSILITGKIAFGEPPIEPFHRKGYDFLMADADAHYRVLTDALADLIAAHKSGALGQDAEVHFPYARAARDFWPSPDSAGKLDRLIDFIGRIAPQLFIPAGTDPQFLARWREDVLFGLAHKDAVIAWLHADPDYTGLCHANLNIDNAWYWRDATGALHVGLLDWGGAGQMSIGQALSSMLMMPEPEGYIALQRATIARLVDRIAAQGGVGIDAETLRRHYKASVFSTAIWILVDYVTDMLFQFPESAWATMRDRFDERLTGSGLYSAIIWIDNMLRDWLDDLTPGDVCRQIVAVRPNAAV